jgi:tetratricopeptide (TPR) repeat protein
MSGDAGDSGLELERAQALVELRRFDEACSLLQTLVAREPDDPYAWCLLAQAQSGADRPHDALAAASRAAALAPEDDWPHRLRSVALQSLGADESAVAAAQEAVRVGPYGWQSHARLAISLVFAKGDLAEALAEAERSVELAPNEPNTHYALGLVAEASRNRQEAELCYRHALALDPEHGPSHNALASMQLAAGQWSPGGLAGAASGFRDAVQADPRAAYSARNLELVLRHFLARVSYLVFVIVWLASRISGGALDDRVGPLLLLLIPAGFAVRFLAGLAPDLRRQVRYMAVHGPLALPMILQASAVGLLFVGAAVPSGDRIVIGAAALITSLVARLLLARRSGSRLVFAPWAWFKRNRTWRG